MRSITQALLFLLFSGVALAQFVEVDIRPDDLLGGTADEQLRDLGRQAAEEGLDITLTSPGYWREMIEEQLRAGAGDAELSISHRQTFVESVIVRMGQRPAGAVAEARRPDPAPEPEPEPEVAPPPPPEAPVAESRPDRAAVSEQLRVEAEAQVAASVEAPAPPAAVPELRPEITRVDPSEVMGVATEPAEEEQAPAEAPAVASADPTPPAPEPETVPPVVETPPAPEPEPEPAREEIAMAEPEPEPEPAPIPVAEAQPEPVTETTDEMPEAEARASLERRLNGGRPINKTLSVGQLRRGDQLFTTGGLAAAVRPSRIGRNVYWVEGPLDTEVEELRRVQAGKYDVLGSIDVAEATTAPVAQAPSVAAAPATDAPAPEAAAPAPEPAGRGSWIDAEELAEERAEMEARYNLGRPIESTVSTAGLLTNDMLYVGTELTVIVRRDKVGLKRYWLDGELDFSIEELEQAGSNKYRVRRAIR